VTDLAVARSFGRSASSYDAHAHVQLAASQSLVAMVDAIAPRGVALDLGAGTVPMARRLTQQNPDCRWLALDISRDMLCEARSRGRLDQGWQSLCADAEKIPLKDAAVNLVYSCFALQWCSTPAAALAEIFRVLAPGGQAVIAVPVAGSLQEFRDSWQQVDAHTHFNRLPTASAWLAGAAGLQCLDQQTLSMREHYPDVRAIVNMLKATGADHVRREQAPGLMTPSRLGKVIKAYDTLREPQGLPLSWQVLFMTWLKPDTE